MAQTTIAEYDAAVFRYVQSANMTPNQYADNLVAKSSNVSDVYLKGALNDGYIKGFDASIRHSLRDYSV